MGLTEDNLEVADTRTQVNAFVKLHIRSAPPAPDAVCPAVRATWLRVCWREQASDFSF
jgi:hypothetical protein